MIEFLIIRNLEQFLFEVRILEQILSMLKHISNIRLSM